MSLQKMERTRDGETKVIFVARGQEYIYEERGWVIIPEDDATKDESCASDTDVGL